MSHKKHKAHPHDTMSAMPQFNAGHWERDINNTLVSDGKYSSEMGQLEEYTKSVNALSSYAKKHKAQH